MKNEIALYAIALFGVIVFGALVYLNLQAGPQHVTTTTNNTLSSIIITASGAASNKTTEAQIYLTINATGATNAAAVQNISSTVNTFNSTVSKYVNYNMSRISTDYFNVYKNYNQTGYTATESLSVVIPSISNASSVILALSSIPNVYVQNVQSALSPSQITSLRSIALSAALANATSQARALIGNNTIYSTNITVNSYYFYPRVYYTSGVSSGGGSVKLPLNSTIFYGGRNSVTEQLTVTFIYGPGKTGG